MGDDGSGAFSNIISGMNWVRDHVKRNGWRGVVNMSLGGECRVQALLGQLAMSNKCQTSS